MEGKKCKCCLEERDFKLFYKGKGYKDGYFSKCKICFKKERNENRIPVSGFIYGITNPAWAGWVKVGRALNADRRVQSYQTSSPFRDYEVKFTIEVFDLWKLEKFIYNKYNCDHEWINKDYKKIEKEILKFIK